MQVIREHAGKSTLLGLAEGYGLAVVYRAVIQKIKDLTEMLLQHNRETLGNERVLLPAWRCFCSLCRRPQEYAAGDITAIRITMVEVIIIVVVQHGRPPRL